MLLNQLRSLFVFSFALLALCHCGIVTYPGQTGLVTNNYAKIDMEYLDEPGLFVYETVYDNRTHGQGVGAIITKLYPGAKTYTSNVRTNAEGTLFRAKGAYDGAEVQMISIPNLHQVHVSPNSQVAFLLEYATSLDEIDETNTAEKDLFKKLEINPILPEKAFESKKFRWDLLRAGNLTPSGNLAYEITSMEMNQMKFTPTQPVTLETNFFANGLRSNLTAQTKTELIRFVEANFPKGYKGTVNMQVKGSSTPIPMRLGVHTLKTLANSGTKVTPDATEAMAQEILARFKANMKEGQ